MESGEKNPDSISLKSWNRREKSSSAKSSSWQWKQTISPRKQGKNAASKNYYWMRRKHGLEPGLRNFSTELIQKRWAWERAAKRKKENQGRRIQEGVISNIKYKRKLKILEYLDPEVVWSGLRNEWEIENGDDG